MNNLKISWMHGVYKNKTTFVFKMSTMKMQTHFFLENSSWFSILFFAKNWKTSFFFHLHLIPKHIGKQHFRHIEVPSKKYSSFSRHVIISYTNPVDLPNSCIPAHILATDYDWIPLPSVDPHFGLGFQVRYYKPTFTTLTRKILPQVQIFPLPNSYTQELSFKAEF